MPKDGVSLVQVIAPTNPAKVGCKRCGDMAITYSIYYGFYKEVKVCNKGHYEWRKDARIC